ncbi:MAG: hypothetical protein LQ340_002894 [Diploschistes diacapsis]|nr:MAG: hypothetical protein LQ340_002894 [Diploschistes diacapsis]
MPRPGLPPTPTSSVDLLANDDRDDQSIGRAFNLPPPAIESIENSASTASVNADSLCGPLAPTSSGRRSGKPDARQRPGKMEFPQSAQFTLPPPPTRPRRIIQMKPGTVEKGTTTPTKPDKKKAAGGQTRPNPTATVAGKKTARKTAHSIIERRRRSKMNGEFETLREMIPACRGHSMHKLAILQAGIDYMRYLEQCVADLKGANRAALPVLSHSQAPTPRPRSPAASEISLEDEEDDSFEEMEGLEETRQESFSAPESLSSRRPSAGCLSTFTSPDILPQQPINRSTNVFSPSAAFGACNDGLLPLDRTSVESGHFANTSPAILPTVMYDAAHEATAALLMLNHDRRHVRPERRTLGGGLSVRDLLSS